MSALKKLVSQTAVYGLPTILGRFLNYLLVPLYTKLFMPEAYGIVSTLYALAALMNVLLTYGMETTYFRFASENRPRVFGTALNTIILTSILFFVLAWPNADAIADWLDEPGQGLFVKYFIIILACDAMAAIPLAHLRQQGKALRFSLVRSVNIFSNIFFNMLLLVWLPDLFGGEALSWLSWYEPQPLIDYIFIANLISSGLTLLLLIPEFRGVEEGVDAGLWKKMMAYTAPLILVGTAGIVNETVDRLLLKFLLPEDRANYEIGVYSACYKLSIVMSLFIQAYRFAAEPFFFSRAKEGDRSIYAVTTHFFSLFCLGIFLLVTLFLDVFKEFLRDEKYHEGLHVVPILLLANLFLGLYYNQSIWYKLADRTGIGARISLIAAAITLLLNFLLIPLVGYLGSAWATLFVYFFMSAVNYYYGQKYFPIPYRVRSFVLYLGLTLLLYLLGQLTDHLDQAGVRYALKTLLLLSFGAVVWLVEKPNKLITSQR